MLLGHWFEMRARGGANDAIRTLPHAESFAAAPGHGAVAVIEGRRLIIGNTRMLDRENTPLDECAELSAEFAGDGRTIVQVALMSGPAA